MIDGIEKRVPLLPVTTDFEDGSVNLTPRLHELVASTQVPQRSIRRESVEYEDTSTPVIPRRPGRKMSTGSVDDGAPIVPMRLTRQESIKSNASVEGGDDSTPLRKTTSIKSIPETSVPQNEEPVIPPRPIRQTSIKSIPHTEDQPVAALEDGFEPKLAEAMPLIPPRPRRSSIKSIPESQIEPPQTTLSLEPMMPPRPTRKSSIKSVSETEDVPPPPYGPAIPPPPRTSSIKSVPETEVPAEEEPIIPPRPTKAASIRSIQETESPERDEPIIPRRAMRKTIQSSTASGKEPFDQVDKDSEPIAISPRPSRTPSVKSMSESTTDSMPVIPPRPTRNASVKSFKSQHSIEEEPRMSGDEHRVKRSEQVADIPDQPKKIERFSAEGGPADTAPPVEQVPSSPHKHPSIPPRPQKKDAQEDLSISELIPATSNQEEPGIQPVGIAAVEQAMQIPIIPPRPKKSMPKVTVDQTPLVTRQAKSSSSEIQSEVAHKATGKPPIPARPQHKLAKQFEAAIAREKPVPPPRPAKPPVTSSVTGGGAGSKFAGLRAQFAKDLNERLAKPPPPPPQKEVVHSMQSEESAMKEAEDAARTEGTVKVEAVGDMRKGRARGPQRRPPTVKPIIPDGWGISTMSRIFEQRRGEGKGEVETQPGEKVIESGAGIKTVYVEGGPGREHVVHVETKDMENPLEEGKCIVEDGLVHAETVCHKVEEKPHLESTEQVEEEAVDVEAEVAASPALEPKADPADIEETQAAPSAPEELKAEPSEEDEEEEVEHFQSADEEPKQETLEL